MFQFIPITFTKEYIETQQESIYGVYEVIDRQVFEVLEKWIELSLAK